MLISECADFLFNPSLKDMPKQKIRDLYPGCYIFKDAEELKRLLVDVVLQNNDTLSAARKDMLTYTVDIEKTKNNAFFLSLIGFPELVTQVNLIKICAS